MSIEINGTEYTILICEHAPSFGYFLSNNRWRMVTNYNGVWFNIDTTDLGQIKLSDGTKCNLIRHSDADHVCSYFHNGKYYLAYLCEPSELPSENIWIPEYELKAVRTTFKNLKRLVYNKRKAEEVEEVEEAEEIEEIQILHPIYGEYLSETTLRGKKDCKEVYDEELVHPLHDLLSEPKEIENFEDEASMLRLFIKLIIYIITIIAYVSLIIRFI